MGTYAFAKDPRQLSRMLMDLWSLADERGTIAAALIKDGYTPSAATEAALDKLTRQAACIMAANDLGEEASPQLSIELDKMAQEACDAVAADEALTYPVAVCADAIPVQYVFTTGRELRIRLIPHSQWVKPSGCQWQQGLRALKEALS